MSQIQKAYPGGRRKPAAVVFDMDGVILDSERAGLAVWQVLAEKYGFPDLERTYLACTGSTAVRTREIMLETYGQDFPYDRYCEEAWQLYHARYDEGRMPLKPGIRELLDWLQGSGIRIALASSSDRSVILPQLRWAGLDGYFEKIVSGDMVAHSKPAPDIYAMACEQLGVLPADACAVEDSFNGIRSAFAAGLQPIMVPDLISPTEEIAALACTVQPDLYQVLRWLEQAAVF